ncbi:MAG TPA: hypothetical protein VK966_06610 [Longimicrobiales bacterium]|nr:hypothetical protein [Longimicrobiales bacterium]
MPGFRPGKEPPHLKKQAAKQQFGGNLNRTQERLVELFAERTPEESRALIRKWSIGGLVTAIIVALLGVLLMLWSVIAGVIVLILAAGLFYMWWRLNRQRGDLEQMADFIGGGTPPEGMKGPRRRRGGPRPR